MKTPLRVTLAVSILLSTALACNFSYDPASAPAFVREEGWYLPGVNDDDPNVKANVYGLPPLPSSVRAVPGVKARLLRRDEDHYVVDFPAQVFSISNERKHMHPMLAKASIVRWELNGHVFAYSYGLIPVRKAYKRDGRWIYEGELGCVFHATFIDDKGDGVFRIMTTDVLSPALIPQWVKPPNT